MKISEVRRMIGVFQRPKFPGDIDGDAGLRPSPSEAQDFADSVTSFYGGFKNLAKINPFVAGKVHGINAETLKNNRK